MSKMARLEMKPFYDPVRLTVGWLVGLSSQFRKKPESLTSPASIGALVNNFDGWRYSSFMSCCCCRDTLMG